MLLVLDSSLRPSPFRVSVKERCRFGLSPRSPNRSSSTSYQRHMHWIMRRRERRSRGTLSVSCAADNTFTYQSSFDLVQPTRSQVGFRQLSFYRLISERANLVPTEEMYEYATLATLGDDVYFEPSTM